MQLQTLVNDAPFLKEIANLPVSDVRTSYRIGLFLNKVEPYLKAYQEALNKLIEKYADTERDIDNPQNVRIKKENIEAYTKEMTELGNDNIEITPPEINIDIYKSIDCLPNLFYRLFGLVFNSSSINTTTSKEITIQEAYDSFAALFQLGSKNLKGDLQQRLIKNGASLFTVLELCDKEQETIREESKDIKEYLQKKITVGYYPLELNELSRYPVEPSVFAKLYWMITE